MLVGAATGAGMITGAGFVVHDNRRVIYGCGRNVEMAWANAKQTFLAANVQVRDVSEVGDWIRMCDLSIRPATALLLALMEHRGLLTLPWTQVEQIACTLDEVI